MKCTNAKINAETIIAFFSVMKFLILFKIIPLKINSSIIAPNINQEEYTDSKKNEAPSIVIILVDVDLLIKFSLIVGKENKIMCKISNGNPHLNPTLIYNEKLFFHTGDNK
jgi:hypothetical protein